MSATPGRRSARSAARARTVVGQQQLAARRRPQAVGRDLEAALVGRREPADLLDRVAPELDPERVLLGGREDVEDAAADGELAAALDEVRAGVGRGGEPLDDVLERDVVPRPQRHRLEVAEPAHERLQDGAHRRDDDRDRAGVPAVLRARLGRLAESGGGASGCARRRRTASRRPTVSLRGLSRSCGSVSHEGNSATDSAGRKQRSAAARSSASRPVAVTARTGRPAPVGASAASAATSGARRPGGPVTSSSVRPRRARRRPSRPRRGRRRGRREFP
jgi:hypothetical protein